MKALLRHPLEKEPGCPCNHWMNTVRISHPHPALLTALSLEPKLSFLTAGVYPVRGI